MARNQLAAATRGVGVPPTRLKEVESSMSIINKITGRAKKAAGDLADDPSLRRQGKKEEAKGDAKEKQARAEERAEEEGERAADLERKT